MYDSGNPFGPYGAHAKDTGISGYYGFSAAYQIDDDMLIMLDWDLHKKIGKGAELKYLDGNIKEYKGRDIEVIGIGISYLF